MLEFLIWFVASFISTLGYTYLYYKLNDIKFEFKLRILFVFIIGVTLATLLNYYDIGGISALSYFVFYPILYYVVKPCSFKKLIYYIFVVWIIALILDFTSMLIISFLYYIFEIDVNSCIFIISTSLYVFIMFILMGNLKFIKKIIDTFYKLINKIKYSDFMLIGFTIFMFIVGLILALNLHHISIGLMGCILALLIVIIFALLLRTKYNELENNIFVEILRKNNDFYINMDKEQSIFKHNLISKLLSVKSVSNKEARLLIQYLIEDFNSNIDYSRKIEDIPYGLDGIINEKIYPYNDEIEIKVDNKIKVDIFDVLKPRRYNVLVEKLSLILDNAIEACLGSADKILVINLYEEDNQIFIEVKNSFSGKMNVDDLGKVNYSSKGKRRGFGLYSALRNNEVNLKVKVINNMFVAKLIANENLNIE